MITPQFVRSGNLILLQQHRPRFHRRHYLTSWRSFYAQRGASVSGYLTKPDCPRVIFLPALSKSPPPPQSLQSSPLPALSKFPPSSLLPALSKFPPSSLLPALSKFPPGKFLP